MEVEPPHPNDDIEDWAEVLAWLRENWESIPLVDRWSLKKMLDRVAQVNQSEREQIANLDRIYAQDKKEILEKHEKRREQIRQDFRKATGTEDEIAPSTNDEAQPVE